MQSIELEIPALDRIEQPKRHSCTLGRFARFGISREALFDKNCQLGGHLDSVAPLRKQICGFSDKIIASLFGDWRVRRQEATKLDDGNARDQPGRGRCWRLHRSSLFRRHHRGVIVWGG